MTTSCEFQLSHLNGVYYSGENVEGTIVLNTTSPTGIRDARLRLKGEGKVCWDATQGSTTNNNNTNSNRSIYFKSNEKYIDKFEYILEDGTLTPGTHTCTFKIPLSRSCPTSLEGRYGHIRYELILYLNGSFSTDNVFSKPITVIRSCDLNLIPAYKRPVVCEDITTTCCWPFSRGNIMYILKTPFGGYAPGQRIKYFLHVQNQTMFDIYGYSVEFRKKMSFKSHTPRHESRDEWDILYMNTYDSLCLRLTTRIFKGHILIPSISPSTNNNGIISVEYSLNITLFLGSCKMDAYLTIPIFIGTVPLNESLAPVESSENLESIQIIRITQPTTPDLPAYEDDDSDLPPNYRNFSPPTFEEAVRSSSPFVDIDKDERHRNTGFRPLYPMYSQTDE